MGVSVLARSHTFHCYSLVAKAKTQNLASASLLAIRHLAIHGDALTSNVLFESWTSPVEFLHALSSTFIDAIPLPVLSKLRNFLWLGSPGGWNGCGISWGLFAS